MPARTSVLSSTAAFPLRLCSSPVTAVELRCSKASSSSIFSAGFPFSSSSVSSLLSAADATEPLSPLSSLIFSSSSSFLSEASTVGLFSPSSLCSGAAVAPSSVEGEEEEDDDGEGEMVTRSSERFSSVETS